MTDVSLGFIRRQLKQHQASTIPPPMARRRAAVALILRPGQPEDPHLLFIRRALHPEDPWSGHMAFPGGRQEPSDPGPLEAAQREAAEEVGIVLAQQGRLLGALDEVQASAGGRVLPLAISPFVFDLHQEVELTCNHEVQEALWVPFSRLLDPAVATTVPYRLGGQDLQLPALDISGRIIWGLTYRMLSTFFLLLGQTLPGLGRAVR